MKKDRHGSAPDHLVRHAPQNQTGHTAPAMGSHGHEIDVSGLGKLQDSFGRMESRNDLYSHGESLFPEGTGFRLQCFPGGSLFVLEALESMTGMGSKG